MTENKDRELIERVIAIMENYLMQAQGFSTPCPTSDEGYAEQIISEVRDK